jgi:glycine/D-amino acid oxidase-like deaminating enzyme
LYYTQQNARTGDLSFGGNKAHIEEIINSDDRELSPISKNNVSTLLPKLFHKRWSERVTGAVQSPCVHSVWSGIIGSTPDHLPLVGKLPSSVTGRGAEGCEWIAAGYNGYGMVQCWSSGEAIARMALGEPTPQWLPDVYLVTEERLKDEIRMGTEAALGPLL